MRRSFLSRIRGRYKMYKALIQVNNRSVGLIVEFFGNKVRMDGLVYSVDCPLISTRHKSTLYFGLHEMEERKLVERWLPDNVPVIEFGGGMGVVSCLTNKKLKKGIGHVVVEANPAMISILERNKDLNGCDFKIFNCCLAYGSDSVLLSVDKDFVGSTALDQTEGEGVAVPTISLAALIEKEEFSMVFVVCDIEGLEKDLIRNEITKCKSICGIIVEMQPDLIGQDEVDKILLELQEAGFDLKDSIGATVFLHRPASPKKKIAGNLK